MALCLAAERANTRPHLLLADLTQELADQYDRLDLLATDDDETTAVRAAFSWFYKALAPAAAQMFRLLGLHPGPEISLAAVEQAEGALCPVSHSRARCRWPAAR